MAVDKMERLSIVGPIEDVDRVARTVILSASVHIADAISEVGSHNLSAAEKDRNIEGAIDTEFIKRHSSNRNLEELGQKVGTLLEIFKLKEKVHVRHLYESYSIYESAEIVNRLYETVKDKYEKIKQLNSEISEINEFETYLSYLKNFDISLSELMNMKHINMRMGRLSSYDMKKLRQNYENIKAIVIKLHQDIEKAEVLLFVPEEVQIEVERILVSLNFHEFKPLNLFNGSPEKWLEGLRTRKSDMKSEITRLKAEMSLLKRKNTNLIEKAYSRYIMETKIEGLKSNIAYTNEFFYMTGWVPTFEKKNVLKELEDYEDRLIVNFKGSSQENLSDEPPTRLRNGYFTKPFETIVRMYGVPSYNEIDPTAFVGLSYMILFGSMFGDVGQGGVLLLAGLYLCKIKGMPEFGEILERLGISSIVFGFLYGSIFGFEDILPTYIVKPIIDIAIMLEAAVILGVMLISVGYIYNCINSIRNKNIEAGFFSGNGLAGLAFYWVIIYLVVSKIFSRDTFIPAEIFIIILAVLITLMVFKQPVTHLIMGIRPLYSESKMDYYIESGFGIIEMLLSMFSNTVSFIRVGAFAINHVGLFIAFETLAHMMSSGIKGAFTIILGNIIIITLEGLIVFIQGLRLEYYELFSKFFSGSGYDYEPYLIDGCYPGEDGGEKT